MFARHFFGSHLIHSMTYLIVCSVTIICLFLRLFLCPLSVCVFVCSWQNRFVSTDVFHTYIILSYFYLSPSLLSYLLTIEPGKNKLKSFIDKTKVNTNCFVAMFIPRRIIAKLFLRDHYRMFSNLFVIGMSSNDFE